MARRSNKQLRAERDAQLSRRQVERLERFTTTGRLEEQAPGRDRRDVQRAIAAAAAVRGGGWRNV